MTGLNWTKDERHKSEINSRKTLSHLFVECFVGRRSLQEGMKKSLAQSRSRRFAKKGTRRFRVFALHILTYDVSLLNADWLIEVAYLY
jgi:hypothetical protein